MPRKRKIRPVPDPLWYKDAVIYQLHIKSFFDSNNDGIGDIPGLIAKLDYLTELGINTVWLLPFYPSPRRDDGYDIADYRGVHPEFGTLSDVRRFIRGAHARGIRVVTELVVNHTSDQHPWFQRARRAPPGSVARNFYVWSDTDKAYADTRIIFVDTEKSNWAWDEEAKAYYWHRFYAHQPDLNYDNPHVVRAVLSVMKFWLDMGVDGLRLDAVPYLVEREGTNSENLPETHAIVKKFRNLIDKTYPDRMLLAEANQWPEDVQEYFGKGDECHMVFHFPLMPRMYMAIAQEDRYPLTDIIRQTPDIPSNCQWAIFLRNHDELTLEMVTDRERDYLWEVYACDKRARLNLGIRRRLSPLLEHDRRRIELMNGLLLTMPGTPIIYYGDEIGMGDNIYLGDRDGVRTPMQWSSDRNGGFSRADPASLVLPTVMDPLYGYQAVNVEAQWRDAHSLLNWLRRMLVVRSKHHAFGRGKFRLLSPQNRRVLAYLREHEDETLLCVFNVARTAQAVELDLAEFAGRTPVELLGSTPFPLVGQLTYLLTLPPYGFYWFLLSKREAAPLWSTATSGPFVEPHTFVLRAGLAAAIPSMREELERRILPLYIPSRRWFQQKDEKISAAKLIAAAPMPGAELDAVLADVEITTPAGKQTYALPMAIAWEDAPSAPFEAMLARARRGRRVGLLTDGFAAPSFARALLKSFANRQRIPFGDGEIVFLTVKEGLESIPADAEIEWPRAEQSNSTLVVGKKAVVKLFRRISRGIHPEAEMGRVLTERGFTGIAPLYGEVVRSEPKGDGSTLAVVQRFVANQGNGADWTMNQLARVIDEQAVARTANAPEAFEAETSLAHVLGRRVGEMHAVLAQPTDDPAFAPERTDQATLRAWCDQAQNQIKTAFKQLGTISGGEERSRLVKTLLGKRGELLRYVEDLFAKGCGCLRTRIHGDLHLGQVLVSAGDVVIIDFEGEPTKPLAERRAKSSPMRDVAGMIRSFDYAAAITERDRMLASGAPGEAHALELLRDFRRLAEDAFLEGYVEGRGEPLTANEKCLIDAFTIEKAAYEIAYEIANRPDWVDVPLRGLASPLERIPAKEPAHG